MLLFVLGGAQMIELLRKYLGSISVTAMESNSSLNSLGHKIP
jgi:hypothetical protein